MRPTNIFFCCLLICCFLIIFVRNNHIPLGNQSIDLNVGNNEAIEFIDINTEIIEELSKEYVDEPEPPLE